jgi:Rps23 Pro-64 3,4-dihydroxylase Tpa1-like proline 4-hydroxylase
LVRRDLGDIRALLQARALAVLPSVLPALGMPPFTPREVQVELAAHGDGGFYGPHVDTTLGSPAPPRPRRFTLVYYLHRRPRAFSGGALRLLALNGAFLDVEPAHDLAAAFPSWLPHEVRPVAVPGGDFADSRFSFNIWMLG